MSFDPFEERERERERVRGGGGYGVCVFQYRLYKDVSHITNCKMTCCAQ